MLWTHALVSGSISSYLEGSCQWSRQRAPEPDGLASRAGRAYGAGVGVYMHMCMCMLLVTVVGLVVAAPTLILYRIAALAPDGFFVFTSLMLVLGGTSAGKVDASHHHLRLYHNSLPPDRLRLSRGYHPFRQHGARDVRPRRWRHLFRNVQERHRPQGAKEGGVPRVQGMLGKGKAHITQWKQFDYVSLAQT